MWSLFRLRYRIIVSFLEDPWVWKSVFSLEKFPCIRSLILSLFPLHILSALLLVRVGCPLWIPFGLFVLEFSSILTSKPSIRFLYFNCYFNFQKLFLFLSSLPCLLLPLWKYSRLFSFLWLFPFLPFGCWSLFFRFPRVPDAHRLSVNIEEWWKSLLTCVMVGFPQGVRGEQALLLEGAWVSLSPGFSCCLFVCFCFFLGRPFPPEESLVVTSHCPKTGSWVLWLPSQGRGPRSHSPSCPPEHSTSHSPSAVRLVAVPRLLWSSFSVKHMTTSTWSPGSVGCKWAAPLCPLPTSSPCSVLPSALQPSAVPSPADQPPNPAWVLHCDSAMSHSLPLYRDVGISSFYSESVTTCPPALHFLSHLPCLCGVLSFMFLLLF